MSETSKLDNEELKNYVRKKIEELRSELQYLEELLKILEGERSLDASILQATRVDVIAVGDSVIANVIVSNEGLRVILTEALPANHPLITSFLVRILEEQKGRGFVEAYRINEKRGYIYDIEVKGKINNLVYKEIEAAISYVWSSMREKSPT
ncbi:MAG: hypothetical protein LM561_06360 [Desulfurococcaceae archaeon]|nr:hypothetical protein [Desulfurococcaceae archaeon]